MSNDEVENADKYHRLANVSLRTLATTLAIIFAYTISAEEMPSTITLFISILSWVIFVGIVFSIDSLYGESRDRIKRGAIFSTWIMGGALASMICLLIWLLYQRSPLV